MHDYSGKTTTNSIDIIKYLNQHTNKADRNKAIQDNTDFKVNIFYANPDNWYNMNNLLTIDTEEGAKTMKVSEWVVNDPVSFDKVKRKFGLKVHKDVYNILTSRIAF